MTDGVFAQVRAGMAAPDKAFLVTGEGVTVTYGDMERLSARFAATLIALGVGKGDRVAAQTEKSPEALMLYLACLRAGAVYLPLNTAYTPAEIGYFLGDAEPRVFVCDPAKEDALASVAQKAGVEVVLTMGPDGEGSFTERAAGLGDSVHDVAVTGDDLAAILYTSGTTGRSKGAMLSHDNLLSNARTLVGYWGFTERDVLLHALPIFHTHGLFVATNVSLLAGATMLFLPRFDADAVVRLLPRATSMMGVPTFYARLLGQTAFDRDLVSHMRLFISGSAPLSAETHREFSARTGHAILERYGMTETNMNTSNPLDGERIPGTVGFPLPGVALRIADPETGAVLPQGEIGVIEVRGPNVFKGYWRNPEKTALEFRQDGFFITGDLGRVDERGYVSIVGRGKDLVISGGFNVYPAEVETELDSLPGVAESAVIGVPHADFGEGVTAVVAPRPGATLDEAGIQAALAGKLAKFKVPKRVVVVDALPRNTMGKIQKNVLRDTYKDLYA
ncbi:malonate--CoA ligase [Marinivivus vitaminiproducens]|uniref:malonate--CoA ligase n=1 Tax=Marinivivus vitaminiproducens TaxID=3035935 RepID=UPI0027A48A93|nr:malonyl-CoA synthase [Geminicoccaceae bacterium SCSIO 64248]